MKPDPADTSSAARPATPSDGVAADDAAALAIGAPARPPEGGAPDTDRGRALRAIAWAVGASLGLVAMNAIMRVAVQSLDPFVAQFLRYTFGLALALPFMLGRTGWLRPRALRGMIWRGITQTIAVTIYNIALVHVPLTDAVAIVFTAPIVVLVGAAIFLRERVTAARWGAATLGLAGVLILLSPSLSGQGELGWNLLMLSSVPFWAAVALITKALTRHDSSETIVAWQNLTITAFMLPMALLFWRTPTGTEFALTLAAGVCGTLGHWCLTRAFALADVSAVQPTRFLDLLWAALLAIVLFGNVPPATTLVGGAIIIASTVWLARAETRARATR